MKGHEKSQDTRERWGTGLGLPGAVAGALAASICCLGPLVLVTLGASGAWIGGLAALEPYRPLFVLAAMGLLGFAFFREYRRPPADSCRPGSTCSAPGARRGMRVGLWVVAALVVGLLVLPYVTPRLVANPTTASVPGRAASVTLAVDNMTCSGCVATVTKAVRGVPGVLAADVTLDPPRAIVRFDPARVAPEQLAAAAAAVGYPARVLVIDEGGS